MMTIQEARHILIQKENGEGLCKALREMGTACAKDLKDFAVGLEGMDQTEEAVQLVEAVNRIYLDLMNLNAKTRDLERSLEIPTPKKCDPTQLDKKSTQPPPPWRGFPTF